MKHAIVLGTALIAAPLAAAAATALPGVSDEETVIRSGQIEEFQRGKGDVVFLRDRENKWYRVALNDGCLKELNYIEAMSFGNRDISGRIDKMTTVNVANGMPRSCGIESIRRSAAPPQVNSKSPVTLD